MSEFQYALVNNGSLVLESDGTPVMTGFLPTVPEGYSAKYPPGCKWVEIKNVDSQPFVLGIHHRETPTYRVNGDHVERVYQVKHAR